jgi:integrase
LTPYVADLLSKLPRANKWVFSSARFVVPAKGEKGRWEDVSATGRLAEPSIQHRRACAVAGLDGLTLHGLRRSFKSLTEWLEVPVGVVAQIMGHKPSATAEKHYTVRPLDMLRLHHQKIEAWMLAQAGIDFANESRKQPPEPAAAEQQPLPA